MLQNAFISRACASNAPVYVSVHILNVSNDSQSVSVFIQQIVKANAHGTMQSKNCNEETFCSVRCISSDVKLVSRFNHQLFIFSWLTNVHILGADDEGFLIEFNVQCAREYKSFSIQEEQVGIRLIFQSLSVTYVQYRPPVKAVAIVAYDAASRKC
jgi:hypothetical protein